MTRLPTFMLLALLLSPSACMQRRIAKQVTLEDDTVGLIVRLLDRYEALHPGERATNVAQLFLLVDLTTWHRAHPALLQQEFRRFGKNAGFKSSFYEKYVPVPESFTNHAVHGKAVFMNAEPFPSYDGKSARYVIWREGPQYHNCSLIPEEEIQDFFRRAAIEIPRPAPMPPPAPPAGPRYTPPAENQIQSFFADLAADYGPGRSFGGALMIIAVILAGVMFSGLVLLVFRFTIARRR